MKTDNALRKTLKKQPVGPSYGFANNVMRQIMLESERIGRKNYYRSLVLVSVVSAGILSGSLFAMSHYLHFSLSGFLNRIITPFLHLNLRMEGSGQLFLAEFSVFLAAIILLLLALDHYIRKRFGKL